MSRPSPFHNRPRRRSTPGVLGVLTVVVLVLGTVPQGAVAADLGATTSTFASVFSGAQGGDVIHLAAGNYGTFNGGSKSGMVTITAQTGAAVTMAANVGSSQNITIDGMTVAGSTVGTTSAPGQHIHFTNDTFTGQTVVRTPTNSSIDVIYDHDTFASINASGYEGRVEVVGNGNNSGTTNGVVIQNSTFGPNGCSDGIQLTGGVSGTQILNNTFTGIKQGSCSPWHVDPIQFYGGQNTLISGNYFHGNSTGIMSPDGNGSPMTVTDNVFVTDGEYPQQIVIGGGSGDVITHNTFANNAQVRIGKVNVGASSNETIKDNVITGGFLFSESQSTSGFTIDYNLISGGGGGTHGINGGPSYVAGASPSTYTGYALTATSLGHNAASDGTDMGINAGGITPHPPDTTISSGPASSTTSTTATFAFTGSSPAGGAVTFTCSLDGAAYASCTSPTNYTGLAVGAHTFQVRATDLGGLTDATPASMSWTVTSPDTTPPDTMITSAPSGSTTSTSASVAFSATETATFQCRIDGGAWSACTSPKAYSGLGVAAHTVDVRATDTAGNVDATPASASWTVTATATATADAPPPVISAPAAVVMPQTTITTAPPSTTSTRSATFAFTADSADASFQCTIDGGAWTACSSPRTYKSLTYAKHAFQVRATDAAGMVDPTPAADTWTVARRVRTATTATYTFEVLSASPGTPSTVQAADATNACASTTGSSASVAVELHRVHRASGTRGRVHLSGALPAFAARHDTARLRVSVRRHGAWHMIASRGVDVTRGSFGLTLRASGVLRVSALVRCG